MKKSAILNFSECLVQISETIVYHLIIVPLLKNLYGVKFFWRVNQTKLCFITLTLFSYFAIIFNRFSCGSLFSFSTNFLSFLSKNLEKNLFFLSLWINSKFKIENFFDMIIWLKNIFTISGSLLLLTGPLRIGLSQIE